MRTRSPLAVAALAMLAWPALADKLLDDPVRITAPRALGEPPQGGIASQTVYYDNTGAPYGYVFFSSAQPRMAMDDIQLAPPGQSSYFTDEQVIAWYHDLPEDFDLVVHFWDEVLLTPSDPANSAFMAGYRVSITALPPGAWYSVLDLSALTGVTFSDDSLGLELKFMEPDSSEVFSNTGTPTFPITSTGPNVGFSNDVYLRDSDGNGRYNIPPDNRTFGGAPYLASFYAALADSGAGGGPCCPADTNCDGSVNGFDIGNFIQCLSGGCVGPCSACVADMNGDGSINGFDIGGFIAAVSGAGQVLDVAFSQLDFELQFGTHVYYDTGWGELALSYQSAPHTLYLNLNVNGQWAIENIPVVQGRGTCGQETMHYAFGLGTPPGADVTSVVYGISLTSEILLSPPALNKSAPVSDETQRYAAGKQGGDADVDPAGPAQPLKGADEEPDPHPRFSRKDMPNQECGPMECGPAAISNSLLWLKDVHKIKDAVMAADDISIAKMKTATEWNNGVGGGWFDKKDAYMKANKLPIATKTVPIDKLIAEMDNNCDCEIDGAVHIVAILGVTKLKDGTYSIDIRHDTDQTDDTKGTKDETVIYDPTTGKLKGGKWLDGKVVDHFVVECYRP